uniref:NADH dehydrogenase subunit 2 n=1 Tax=Pisidia serratifrons TaxID=761937 RepID=UPI00226CA4A3|nr:NADH dehydrogenase subunit 2 [Pisidia serratifrons]UZA47093.1 NADH dehydrogenase subunit 2 [Pisidia serratifrons]
MYLSNFNMIFLSTLLLGSILAVSSFSWFSTWVGLELNLLSIIPLMINEKNKYSSESALKYFLVQAFSSSLIIFSSTMLMFSSKIFFFILMISLLLKMGSAPFHFWFPMIMEGLLWPQALIMLTIQKLAPMFLLCTMMKYFNISNMLIFSAICSSLTGAILGINQTSLRKILAFSSINHMSWMLAAILINEQMLFNYFLFYCLISFSVVSMFLVFQKFHFNQLLILKTPYLVKMVSIMSILSLGGLPPFMGFLPKWLMIQEMSNFKHFFMLMIFLFSTLITLYFYIRLSIMFLSINSFNSKTNNFYFKNNNLLMFCYLNFIGMIFPSCEILF